WNPALAFTTINKKYIGGNTISSWMEFSLMIIPSKDVITVFTETRQDWTHGNVAGWYDNLSLRPVPEPTKLLPSQHLKEKPAQERQTKADAEKRF
ncbi:MAG TPA: hypothetical protein ACFYEF_14585, partial [Candidatus Wunengus sp. YC63]|uniref:hypothetical protein n=1 Tax=Candidatus Wunengus sp. YC63 TaxID=3367699 RepID=UPI0040259CFA